MIRPVRLHSPKDHRPTENTKKDSHTKIVFSCVETSMTTEVRNSRNPVRRSRIEKIKENP